MLINQGRLKKSLYSIKTQKNLFKPKIKQIRKSLYDSKLRIKQTRKILSKSKIKQIKKSLYNKKPQKS